MIHFVHDWEVDLEFQETLWRPYYKLGFLWPVNWHRWYALFVLLWNLHQVFPSNLVEYRASCTMSGVDQHVWCWLRNNGMLLLSRVIFNNCVYINVTGWEKISIHIRHEKGYVYYICRQHTTDMYARIEPEIYTDMAYTYFMPSTYLYPSLLRRICWNHPSLWEHKYARIYDLIWRMLRCSPAAYCSVMLAHIWNKICIWRLRIANVTSISCNRTRRSI